MVTQAQSTLGLTFQEEQAIREFTSKVRAAYGEQVRRVLLFGSKARGQSEEFSDIDILLVVAEEDWRFQKAICEISSEISLKLDVVFDVHFIGASRWQYLADIQAGYFRNVRREGIALFRGTGSDESV